MRLKNIFSVIIIALAFISCKKESVDTIGGTQSAIGAVGATVSSSTAAVAGVSSITGRVATLTDGVSSFSGSAVITNATIKNIMSNWSGAVINGNNVSVTGIKAKFTSEGIEGIEPLEPGVIVNYSSEVGDTYKGSNGVVRTVVSKSTTDDYYWGGAENKDGSPSKGGFNIKVMKVEETPMVLGVKKITYIANHRWGLVGVEFTFDDNSVAKFPVFSSASN
jgi:DNA/RNA endonuclease YhcR with UshA esterase domain